MTNTPSSENPEPTSGGSSSAPRYGQRDPRTEPTEGGTANGDGAGNRPGNGSPWSQDSAGYGESQYGQQNGGYRPLPYDSTGNGATDPYANQPRYDAQNTGMNASNGSGQSPYYQGGYGQPSYQQYPSRPGDHPNGWGMGLAALICGIVSVVLCWLVLPGLAGVVAIILGIVAIKKLGRTPGAGKAMPIVGIILGSIGVILSLIVGIIFAIGLSAANEAAQHCGGFGSADSVEFQQCVDSYIESKY